MSAADINVDKQTETTSGSSAKGSVGSRVRDTASSARSRASEAYAAARERTNSLYSSAKDRASSAGTRTKSTVQSNPAAAVAGGLAVGALLAALLPRTEREARTLGPLGNRLNEKAREGVRAAKDTGRSKIDEIGLATVKDKIGEIVSGKKSSSDTAA